MLAIAVAALAVPAPYDLREAAQTVTPKAREPTFAPLAPCDAGFVPTCEQAKGFGLCDSANAACDEACVDEVKMACPVTCSLSAEATSAHLAPDAAPSDYGKHLPPAATEAICSTCAAQPDLPCCHDHPHEGSGRRRLAQSCADAVNGDDGCLGWKQTGGCFSQGPREPGNDRDCATTIESGWSGFCDCGNDRKAMEKGCDPAPYSNCESACSSVCWGSSTTLAEALQQGCHTVAGRLHDGASSGDVGSSGDVNLPSLREVRGGITVGYNANLASLTMDNLEDVGGDIRVYDNLNLASLTMNNLGHVGGGINVVGNPKLASLAMPNLWYGYINVRASPLSRPSALPPLPAPSCTALWEMASHCSGDSGLAEPSPPPRFDPNPASCDLGELTGDCPSCDC